MFKAKKNPEFRLKPASYDMMWDWNVPERIVTGNRYRYLPGNWIIDHHNMVEGRDNIR